MKTHSVQDIRINVPIERAFAFVADSLRLPEWTNAFASVKGSNAVLRTPRGEVNIGLHVLAEPAQGTVDWRMVFPDGTVETAYSRLVPANEESTVFSFVLLAPQGALEELEGGLEQQVAILAKELLRLKDLLENGVAG